MNNSNNEKEPIDDKTDKEANQQISSFRRVLPQVLAVIAKNTLALNFGLCVAFPTIVNAAVLHPNSEIKMNKDQISWIGSMFFIIIPIGSFLSGPCIYKFGSKNLMIVMCIPFAAAWYLLGSATTPGAVYGAVTIQAFLQGLLDPPILTYTAEISEPRLRGMLASSNTLAKLIGVSLQFCMGKYLEWKTSAMINIAFPILSFISMCFVPESPHLLVQKGRIDDAEKSLRWLRGWVGVDVIRSELDRIIESIKAAEVKEKSPFSWKPYMNRTFLRPFGLVIASFFIGHFTGMSTIQTYAISIFEDLESPVNVYSATAAEGLIQLAGALVCVCLLPYIGRRFLAITSTLGTGICFLLIGIRDTGWFALVMFLMAVFLLNTCTRVFPSVLLGEVFPTRVRAVASGIASCAGSLLGFLVNKTYFLSVDLLTFPGVIAVYGCVSILGALLYYLVLPETEGRTLEEIEAHFRGEINLVKNRIGESKISEENC